MLAYWLNDLDRPAWGLTTANNSLVVLLWTFDNKERRISAINRLVFAVISSALVYGPDALSYYVCDTISSLTEYKLIF